MAFYSWRLAALLCMIIIGRGRTLSATAAAPVPAQPSSSPSGSCFRSNSGELLSSATPQSSLSASYHTGVQLECTGVTRPACCGREIETKPGFLNIHWIEPGPSVAYRPKRSEPCSEAQLRTNRLFQAAKHLEGTWASGSPDLHPGSKLEGMEQRVQVAPSSIHGTGLFANSDLDIGTVATFFPVHSLRCVNMIVQERKERDLTHVLHRAHSVECFQHSEQGSCLQYLTMVADPNRKTPGWLGHFANDVAVPASDSEADISEYAAACRDKANCILVPFGYSNCSTPLMVLVVLRKVLAGGELLRAYGPDYWTILTKTQPFINSPHLVFAELSASLKSSRQNQRKNASEPRPLPQSRPQSHPLPPPPSQPLSPPLAPLPPCALPMPLERSFHIFDKKYGYSRLVNALARLLEGNYAQEIETYTELLESFRFDDEELARKHTDADAMMQQLIQDAATDAHRMPVKSRKNNRSKTEKKKANH